MGLSSGTRLRMLAALFGGTTSAAPMMGLRPADIRQRTIYTLHKKLNDPRWRQNEAAYRKHAYSKPLDRPDRAG